MTQQDFVEVLESELQMRLTLFDRATLLSFVASAWPLIQVSPDVGFWAGEFLRSENVAWA
jgi:hypothetical protein